MEIIITGVYDYVPNLDLYEFIDVQYKKSKNFVVCQVTKEEFETMKKMLLLNGYLNERYPKNIELGYKKDRYLLAYNTIENVIEISNPDEPNKKGRYYISQGEIYYDEYSYSFASINGTKNVSLFGNRVYTTESYDDIMHYYPRNDYDHITDDEQRLRALLKRKKEIEDLKIYKEYVKVCSKIDVIEQKKLIRKSINE